LRTRNVQIGKTRSGWGEGTPGLIGGGNTRALATQAPVLLADEPVAALDSRHQIEGLKARARAGAILAEILHDSNPAARFSGHIVLPDQGKIEVLGSPETVLTEARLASRFGIRARIATEESRIPIVPRSPLPDASGACAGGLSSGTRLH
jgi:iron complex transport system ATP-binding protein